MKTGEQPQGLDKFHLPHKYREEYWKQLRGKKMIGRCLVYKKSYSGYCRKNYIQKKVGRKKGEQKKKKREKRKNRERSTYGDN